MDPPVADVIVPSSTKVVAGNIEKWAFRYVLGYISKSAISKCKKCMGEIFATDGEISNNKENIFTIQKEFDSKRRLTYVKENFRRKIFIVYSVIRNVLNQNLHKRGLKKNILSYFADLKLTTCSEHKLEKYIIVKLFKVVMFNYTKQINQIIRNKNVRPIPPTAPKIFLQARKLAKRR